jgi:putative FmdB family regulatory protein
MPVYEFSCPACSERFDRMLRLANRDEPQSCPKCAASPATRRVAGGHFELKGGGWYKDGYHK